VNHGRGFADGDSIRTTQCCYVINEIEFGAEWQIRKSLEVVVAYMISGRTSSKAPNRQEQGHVARLQVQFNY